MRGKRRETEGEREGEKERRGAFYDSKLQAYLEVMVLLFLGIWRVPGTQVCTITSRWYFE